MRRISSCARLSLFMLFGICAASCLLAASQPARAAHTERHDLVGAWSLVSIEVLGPDGRKPDPFYNEGSTGVLMYQDSGWMSVQIVGQPRPALEAAASRPPHQESAEAARQKAAALDSYYAYFGTWDLDAATSTVTHHIKSSLIPGESGMSYTQTVAVEGDTLIFTTKHQTAGVETVQRKVWRRITGPGR